MHIFLIGPGGVGKSTCGSILAQLLTYQYVDLDTKFSTQIGNISIYIKKHGYSAYCIENSKIFYQHLIEQKKPVVYALSSGFMVHEGMTELTNKHKQTVKEYGISIVLLPSQSIKKSTAIIVKRQLSRGFGLDKKKETKKCIRRFLLYKELGDIIIYSYDHPEHIAEKMKTAIVSYIKK